MSGRTALATAVCGLTLALVAVAAGLASFTWARELPDSWGFRGFPAIFALALGGSGFVILRRQPGHPVGWSLSLSGLLSALQVASEEYGVAWFYGGLDLPAASPLAWLNVWIWVPLVVLVGVGAVLYFPDGKLPSPRWRPAIWLALLGSVATSAGAALDPIQLASNMRGIPPPYDPRGLGALAATSASFFSTAGFGSLSVLMLVSALSVVSRLRRARGAERQQIKWFAFAAAANAIAALVNVIAQTAIGLIDVNWEGKLAQYLFIASMCLIPVSLGIAIRRYRLYDIDLVINRTIVYGATSVVLATAFVLIVLALQAPLRPLTAGSELAVATSTMATLAAFQPLRRRVQDAVDRRFYRSRYDAARTLDAFAASLRDDVDLDHLRRDLLAVVGDTLRPAHAGVWLRGVR